MATLRLTLACGDYDRTAALEDGTVRPDGIELTYLRLPVEETFFRMMRHREFEVSELSLSSYVVSLQAEAPPFIAIPVFPSRMFRHAGIFCNAAAGIEKPEDLRGKRVGTPEYQLTASVWQRGILAEHHGVPVDAVTYHTGGLDTPGRIEKAAVRLPQTIRVEPIPPDRTLSAMLAEGEIDALYSPRKPRSFVDGDPRVRRVFDDPVAAERAYFAATGIFPIMHVVVIRRDVYERDRWVAQSLFKAFALAKEQALARFHDTSALHCSLPWLTSQFEQTVDLMGADFWSYGLDAGHDALATFLRYHHEQGLSRRPLTPAELFAPEAIESAVI
jgi:4,5-dihydroxyphthalate decarboxylase